MQPSSTRSGAEFNGLPLWTLAVPRPDYCDIDLVTPYPELLGATSAELQRHKEALWRLMSHINTAKRAVVKSPEGCSPAQLFDYMLYLLAVRERYVYNDSAYIYRKGNGEPHAATLSLDFELYMTLATVAARDSRRAVTYASVYPRSVDAYKLIAASQRSASSVLDNSLRLLFPEYCDATATAVVAMTRRQSQRLRFESKSTVGDPNAWVNLVVENKASPSVPKSLSFMRARVQVLKSDAVACDYRFLVAVMTESNGEGNIDLALSLDYSELFASMAEFVAWKYASVGSALDDSFKATRLGAYAQAMVTIFSISARLQRAQPYVMRCEQELDKRAMALAKMLLAPLQKLPLHNESLLHQTVLQALRQAEDAAYAMLGRIETLQTNTAHIYRDSELPTIMELERTEGVTEIQAALAIPPVDPASLLPPSDTGDDAAAASTSDSTLVSENSEFLMDHDKLLASFVLKHPEFVACLGLRASTTTTTSSSSSSSSTRAAEDSWRSSLAPNMAEGGLNAADRLVNALRARVLGVPEETLRQNIGSGNIGATLGELIGTGYALGVLAERARWLHFLTPPPQQDNNAVEETENERNLKAALRLVYDSLRDASAYLSRVDDTLLT